MRFKRKLEKYFFIPYYTFKQASVYWVNNLLGMISSIIFICIVYYIWSAVYKSGSGFNYQELNKTLAYVVIITIINQIISRNTEMELGSKIVNGNIAVDLIRPINFFTYLFFNRVGVILFNFVFAIIPLLFTAVFIFKVRILTNTLIFIFFFISVMLSFLLVYIFDFLIGLTSFWTSQVFGVSLLKGSLVNILAGLTVPLTFYPAALQKLIFNLPFQAMYYIPVTIYLDLPSKPNLIQTVLLSFGIQNKFLNLLIEQLIWIAILSAITYIAWKAAARKLVIQGG